MIMPQIAHFDRVATHLPMLRPAVRFPMGSPIARTKTGCKMKEHWPRRAPVVKMDAADVGRLILPLFPGNSIARIEAVKGGLINTNLKVQLSNRPGAILLRVYQRGVSPAQKEMAITRLIGDRVPVLHFMHVAEENPITGHPYAILDWIEGVDLQHMLPEIAADRLVELGYSIGRTLAAVHSFSFDKFGFFDRDLEVKGPIDFDGKGLLAYLHQCLIEGPGGAKLGPELTSSLLEFAAREGHILADWPQRPRLVHGDFNGSNILIRRSSGQRDLDIAAIIDWEYALSAMPALDFGDLLRPPFDHDEGFAAAVAHGYRGAGGILPREWQRIARLADMFSFADLLNRPEMSAVVVEDAKKVVRKLIAR